MSLESKKPIILVLEDDPAQRGLLATQLSLIGIELEVLFAASAASAIKLAKAHQPTLAIVDVSLERRESDLKGIKAAESIVKLSKKTHIIFNTVDSRKETRAAAEEAIPGCDFVDKTKTLKVDENKKDDYKGVSVLDVVILEFFQTSTK